MCAPREQCDEQRPAIDAKLARIRYTLTPQLEKEKGEVTKASTSQLQKMLLKNMWNGAFGDYVLRSGFYQEVCVCMRTDIGCSKTVRRGGTSSSPVLGILPDSCATCCWCDRRSAVCGAVCSPRTWCRRSQRACSRTTTYVQLKSRALYV